MKSCLLKWSQIRFWHYARIFFRANWRWKIVQGARTHGDSSAQTLTFPYCKWKRIIAVALNGCWWWWWWWRWWRWWTECYFALQWISRTHLCPENTIEIRKWKSYTIVPANNSVKTVLNPKYENGSQNLCPWEKKLHGSYFVVQHIHTINRFKTDRMHSTLTLTTTTICQHDKHAYARDIASS